MPNRAKALPQMPKPHSPQKSAHYKCGDLTFKMDHGALRAIHFQGIEVLRGISYLVRDENWGTCPAKITNLKVSKSSNAVMITYIAEAENRGAKLVYHATITASGRQLIFKATARPTSDFKTNRTGFVVLHPINQLAGKALTVTHTDGSKQRSRFPKLISPGQPFFEIRALEYAPAPGLKAHILLDGPKFEMEDQRNWTDASYKTYICSLLDPWPYTLKGQEPFEQKITLTLRGRAKPRKIMTQLRRATASVFPEIGVAIPDDQAKKSLHHSVALKKLAPDHLLCTLKDGDLHASCSAYAQLGHVTGIPITLEIILPAQQSADQEMAEIAAAANKANLHPLRIVVTQSHDLKSFQPTDTRPWGPSYEEMAAAARQYFPMAKIGGGMASYFTELNRKRPPKGVFDFITHSICPIVHDASDDAVMQTLESLPHIFATAKSFIGNTPYHLGPSAIGARMNPYGAALAKNPKNKQVCLAPNDPRQFSAFAVKWNRGVLIAAAKAGLHSVTLSCLIGPQGLIDRNGKTTPLFSYLARINKQNALKPKLNAVSKC